MAVTEPTIDDLARLGQAAHRAGFAIFERDRAVNPQAWAEETRFALNVVGHLAGLNWQSTSKRNRSFIDKEVAAWCLHFLKQQGPGFAARLVFAWHLAEATFAKRVAESEAVLANDRLDELAFDYAAVALRWLVHEWYWPTPTEGNHNGDT